MNTDKKMRMTEVAQLQAGDDSWKIHPPALLPNLIGIDFSG